MVNAPIYRNVQDQIDQVDDDQVDDLLYAMYCSSSPAVVEVVQDLHKTDPTQERCGSGS